jgi:hypothetical protein
MRSKWMILVLLGFAACSKGYAADLGRGDGGSADVRAVQYIGPPAVSLTQPGTPGPPSLPQGNFGPPVGGGSPSPGIFGPPAGGGVLVPGAFPGPAGGGTPSPGTFGPPAGGMPSPGPRP